MSSGKMLIDSVNFLIHFISPPVKTQIANSFVDLSTPNNINFGQFRATTKLVTPFSGMLMRLRE
jgi:hypothetical protein